MRALLIGFVMVIAIQVQASQARHEVLTAMVAALEALKQGVQGRSIVA